LIVKQTDQSVIWASILVRSSSGPVETEMDTNDHWQPYGDHAHHRHEGSFAAGQELIEHHPERPGAKGDFATGEELQQHSHQGTFGEGQEQADPHPELLENTGGFAAGQRELTGIRPGNHGLPSFM
jgi:hypothetical protein